MPRIELAALRGQPVTDIVSLGGQCAVAYNARRFFDFNTAYPFDWWGTPLDALVRLVDHLDVERLYDPALLEARPGTVLNTEFSLRFRHEFPYHDGDAGPIVAPDFRDHIAAPRARTEALAARFDALDRRGNRLLLLRRSDPPDRDDDAAAERLDALVAALDRRFQHAAFCLALLHHPPIRPGFRGVFRLPYCEGPGFDWRGDPADWDRAFAPLELTLEPGRHAPFDPERCVPGADVDEFVASHSMH